MPDFLDNHDFMGRSSSLRHHGSTRVLFDPSNKDHCDSLKKFLQSGTWGPVQFFPEYPCTDVPMTVLTKFAAYHLGAKRLSMAEKSAERAAARQARAETVARNIALAELVDPVPDEDAQV